MEKMLSEEMKLSLLLETAIKDGEIEHVKTLVEKGANVNELRPNSKSPLHVATQQGRVDIIEFLIQNGAFVDSTSDGTPEREWTPLHVAVHAYHLECVETLLKNGACVSSKVYGVNHPIYLALYYDYVDIVKLFLVYGTDVDLRFNNSFLEEFEDTLHRSLWFNHNLPLLHYSILCNSQDMIDLLLAAGADVNSKTNLGKTTLMQAVEANDVKLVKYLVRRKQANVNDRDIFGQPVLHFIVLNAESKQSMYNEEEELFFPEKRKILEILVNNGADVNARFPINEDRSSIVHYMIKYGHSSGLYYLLFHSNFNFNEIDSTSIHSARISVKDVTPDLAGNDDYMSLLKYRFLSTQNHLIWKAISLQMIGLPVNPDLFLNIPIHDSITQKNLVNKMYFYKKCIKDEINYMKKTRIGDSNITIWHLLTCKMTELVRLMSNKIIRDFDVFKSYLHHYMPCYNYMLKSRLLYAKERNTLLRKSSEFVFDAFCKRLDFDCCEEIVNFLTNKELKFFVTATKEKKKKKKNKYKEM